MDVTVDVETAVDTASVGPDVEHAPDRPPDRPPDHPTCSEISRLVSNYVSFSRNVAIDAKDMSSLVKMLIASTKSVDKRKVYRAVFPGDPYMDWEHVDRAESCAFGDIGSCLSMVQFLQFRDADVAFKASMGEREDARRLAVIRAFVRNLEAVGLRIPLVAALRMFVLYNLGFLNGSSVLEQFTGRFLKCATHEQVLNLIANFADERFTVENYSDAFVWIMRRCEIHPSFESEVRQHFTQRESMQSLMQIKHVQISSGRPRLLDRLQRQRGMTSISSGHTSVLTGDAMDTFDGWCTRVRFPNTVSLTLKHRLYVIMSQPAIEHSRVVAQFTNTQLSASVLQQTIARPDDKVIARVIEQLDIRMAPFPELTTFVRTCFRAFPQKNIREMTILKYMQLYLAAYQHRDMWKNCWTHIYPLLSYQVIKDVEDFVAKTPFNEDAFIEIIRTE